MFPEPSVLETRVKGVPIAILAMPIVFEFRVKSPIAVLYPPVVLELSAKEPIAVLDPPSVFEISE